MATGINAIATEQEVKTITESSATITQNLCCTKARAITLGADQTRLASYYSNQLVKYSDIVKAIQMTTTEIGYISLNIYYDFNNIPQSIVNSYDESDIYLELIAILQYGSSYNETLEVMFPHNSSSSNSWGTQTYGDYSLSLSFPGEVTHPVDETPIGTLYVTVNLYGKNSDSGSENYSLIATMDSTKTEYTGSTTSDVISDFSYAGQMQSCGIRMNSSDTWFTLVAGN